MAQVEKPAEQRSASGTATRSVVVPSPPGMTAAEARARRLKLLDAKKTRELTERLTWLRVISFHGYTALPTWVRDRLDEVWSTDSIPDATLRDSADHPTVRAWISSFIAGAGVGDRFSVHTGIEHYPWMVCETSGERWLDDLIEQVCGGAYELVLVAGDGAVLVAIHEDEWQYRAYRASERRAPRRDRG
jgi:hypothetical protein